MTDAASPIIIDGQHLANICIGQFHLEQLVEERTEDLRKSEEQSRLLLERLDLTLGATGIDIWERDLVQHQSVWDEPADKWPSGV